MEKKHDTIVIVCGLGILLGAVLFVIAGSYGYAAIAVVFAAVIFGGTYLRARKRRTD
ncbi:hypothetical protein [Actinokineospora terrae]|uniref:Uncharacterized protein n=1 Tax=Actinokineospora terrae TaxID=155974 RepID=A0A1H9LNS8_9PSEU|nr:hypothetical protein [Actinokineospora terrae]SER12795.1 hypothetical protein SAMN04487818_101671 [Actinokineospora terrae]